MRDVQNGGVMVRERLQLGKDAGKKIMDSDEFAKTIVEQLEAIQKQMFEAAKARLDANIVEIKTPEEFKKYFDNQNAWIEDGGKVAFVKGKWSGAENTDEVLKGMKASIRCIPLQQSGTVGKCLITGEDATMDVVYARSY
jgi:prolyl-tRNA synthetase